eukprot:CAMPEP_0170525316 /NCGR_PEP_ID=MMETSP0209-20121228/10812_1 /TAXON_ID=665100 ORGANISM="Litonotus pictus, Strain P1" /NCGR_SAMPLE_ID=MMETSP0209 /ASSEMBLY_ACC=CAM_ASM_000301 /LENGTH=1026 /DNA_ID=CAMNT_0010814531 /DNA_START=14 /DNA_END=3091 /DNA_ORIENTATION=+
MVRKETYTEMNTDNYDSDEFEHSGISNGQNPEAKDSAVYYDFNYLDEDITIENTIDLSDESTQQEKHPRESSQFSSAYQRSMNSKSGDHAKTDHKSKGKSEKNSTGDKRQDDRERVWKKRFSKEQFLTEDNHMELLRLIVQTEERHKQELQSFINSMRTNYKHYQRIYISIHDLIALFKNSHIKQDQILYIWEYLLNTKTDRNFLIDITNFSELQFFTQEEYSSSNIKQHGYFNFGSEEETLENSDKSGRTDKIGFPNIDSLEESTKYKLGKRQLVFYRLLDRVLEIFFKHFSSFLSSILVVVTAKLLNKIKFKLILYLVTSLSLLYFSFSYYTEKHFLASSFLLFQFIYFINSSLKTLFILWDFKDYNYSLFDNRGIVKSRTQFIVKTALSLSILITLIYLSTGLLRYFSNYLLVFYLLVKFKESLDNYLKMKAVSYLQPFPDFSSFALGFSILVFAHFFVYLNNSQAYDLYSLLILSNFIGFYYLTGLSNFFYVLRCNAGKMFIESEKLKITSNEFAMSQFNTFSEDSKKVDFWENLNIKMTKYSRSIISGEDSISKPDILIIMVSISILLLGFYSNTYFFYGLAIYFFKVICSFSLSNYSVRVSRILSSALYIIYMFVLMNLGNLDNRFLNEMINFYDKRFFEALKQMFQLIFFTSLLFVYYLNKDNTDLLNFHNYNGFKFVKEEINNNGVVFLSPSVESITGKLNDIFCLSNSLRNVFFYNRNKVIQQVNQAFEVIKLPSKVLETVFIEDLLKQSESNMSCLPLLLDLFLLYMSFIVLMMCFKTNANSFLFIVGSAHKGFLLLKSLLIHFEYSKTKLQRLLIAAYNLFFLSRIFQMSEELDLLNQLIFIISMLHQLVLSLFVFKLDLWTVMLVGTYGIIYSNASGNFFVVALILASVLGFGVERLGQMRYHSGLLVKMVLFMLLYSHSGILDFLCKSIVALVYSLDSLIGLRLVRLVERKFFRRGSIINFEKHKSFNYLTLLYKMINTWSWSGSEGKTNIEGYSLEQIVIVSISEIMKEITG